MGTKQTTRVAAASKNFSATDHVGILKSKERVVAIDETRCYKGMIQDFGSIFR